MSLSEGAASSRVRRSAERGLAALSALVPVARGVARAVRVYAVVAALAGGVVLLVALRNGLPSSEFHWAAIVLASFVVGAPPLLLWWFSAALLDTLHLPDRLASSPELARTHGRELAALARDAHAQAGSVRRIRLGRGDAVRAGRLLLRAHRDLPGYGGALRLVSVPFLLATALAALVAAIVIALTPLVVLAGLVLD